MNMRKINMIRLFTHKTNNTLQILKSSFNGEFSWFFLYNSLQKRRSFAVVDVVILVLKIQMALFSCLQILYFVWMLVRELLFFLLIYFSRNVFNAIRS